jgi:PAS domain-containing protein
VDDRRPEEFEGDSVADSVTDLSACSLLAALPDTVVVADAEGRVTYVNPAITTLLGHDPAALMGQPLTTIMPTRFRGATAATSRGSSPPGRESWSGRRHSCPRCTRTVTRSPST